MSFGTPWMLLLLPSVAVIGWLMVRARRLQGEAANRLKGTDAESQAVKLSRRDWLILAALACIVTATARPRWNPQSYEVERHGRDLVIGLDVSRSMLAADIFPNRLETARIVIHEALPAFSGQRVGLVTFSGSASVRVPLTLDHGFVRYMLDRADPTNEDIGGTSLQAAVEKVAQTVLADDSGGKRDFILFTDGEDHLSDLDATAQLLKQCNARALIIGLGDPDRGARIPDPLNEGKWMRHNGVEVVSRLEESTLEELAQRAANVTYFSAGVHPFDLVPLYRQWIASARDDVVVGGLAQIRYTEGYPYLLGLAVALWLIAMNFSISRGSLLLLVLLAGCTRHDVAVDEAAYQAKIDRGEELLQFADEHADREPFAEQSLLVDAREEFLRAALLKPGDIEMARRITAVTQRLHDLEKVIEEKRAEESQRREKLTDMIERLRKLTVRQEGLAQKSQRFLRRQPIPTGEYANLPEQDNLLSPNQLKRLIPPLLSEQQAVRKGTASVQNAITAQRDTLRAILTKAYGSTAQLPATEIDPIVDLLGQTVDVQQQALDSLDSNAVNMAGTNTAFHTSAGRMQQALEAMRGLLPPKPNDESEPVATRNAGDLEVGAEEVDGPTEDGQSQSASTGDFQEALSLRSLPIPDYTPAEILQEEAANQQKRARRKAASAGSKVEKNW